ncbi:MAG TPA: hypothetical protein VGM93_10245, partial [Acidimicrobiales bacterium]
MATIAYRDRHAVVANVQHELDEFAPRPRPRPYRARHRAEDRIHLGWAPAPAGCTCRKAPCGYVDDRIDPACPEHKVDDTTR